jgi:hypothetical protein
VAERVLRVEELRRYVDDHVPAPTSKQEEAAAEKGTDVPQTRLRSILARRLMRAGRRQEALRYFDNEQIRSAAEEYTDALATANSWWRWRTARAEAWFTAAAVARFDGMEILGYEGDPDSAMTDGAIGADPAVEAEESPGSAGGGDPDAQEKKPTKEFTSSDELKRAGESAAHPARRFHYRYIAVEHANKAADLLPRSSQAFAAVLCSAAQWMINRDEKAADAIYARYLREGAYAPWARQFGRRCPPPDFAAARTVWIRSKAVHYERHIRAHPLYSVLSGSFAAVFAAGMVMFLRPFVGSGWSFRRIRLRVRFRKDG